MMQFVSSTFLRRPRADVLVWPFWKGKKGPLDAAQCKLGHALPKALFDSSDFNGKEGEVLFLYDDHLPETRIALLGLGESDRITIERLRRAYASLVKACRPRKIKTINLLLPQIPTLNSEGTMRGISEGLLLANYVFSSLKFEDSKDPVVLLEKVTFIEANPHSLALAKKYAGIASGVYLARDLVNGNADDVTPQYLAKVAQTLAKEHSHIKTTVFNKKRIEKEKMGLLLAVNRGSVVDPVFIIVEYAGNPKSKERTALIGKGITYDTGGLHLKQLNSMDTMRCDMGGAAAVLGTIQAAATIGLKTNIIGIIPSTDNAIGPNSYKPGDVYQGYTGKTVEITSTDAEGRLILADALAYTAKHFKPTRMIDIATLTGAAELAFGGETTALLSNNDALADSLIRAGYETYERTWRMPLFEEYREQLKSEIADIKNTGGRLSGVITSSLFLKEFVNDIPWAHCDIAGTAFLNEARRYHPKYATGIGVRLFIEFLENL